MKSVIVQNINYWGKISGGKIEDNYLIYGGDESVKVKYGNLINWKDICTIPIL